MATKFKLKSILIFVAVLVAAILVYVLVFPSRRSEEATLVPAAPAAPIELGGQAGQPAGQAGLPAGQAGDSVSREFLNLLLNIRGIRLDAEGVLADPLFKSLLDFTITLVQEGNEGRTNPFAPIGSDVPAPPPVSQDSDGDGFTL